MQLGVHLVCSAGRRGPLSKAEFLGFLGLPEMFGLLAATAADQSPGDFQ